MEAATGKRDEGSQHTLQYKMTLYYFQANKDAYGILFLEIYFFHKFHFFHSNCTPDRSQSTNVFFKAFS